LRYFVLRITVYPMKPARHPVESQNDILDPARGRALQIALGLSPDIDRDVALPPFFHQLYFWSPQPPRTLGRDGHPVVRATGAGGLIPDTGLPRRMWAGGQLEFFAPLLAGHPAEKVSVVEQVTHKHGRTGPLAIVTVRHEIRQAGILCVREGQDLVYRENHDPAAPQPAPPTAGDTQTDLREVAFNPTLLFRYSALTFNGHRIHYDLDYAREVEGYAGLVVHGPLLAQLLMLMATDLLGPLSDFSFRAASPLMHSETAQLCRDGTDFWVRGPDGRLVMQASAQATS
jgi:3-methylfumaryl-CoA hydratase